MKYHIIGYINGEKKNPPCYLVAANPVEEENDYLSFCEQKPKINYDLDENTVCFILPYSVESYSVIRVHQCDKESGDVVEWEPDMNEYVSFPQTVSGVEHEGWMHVELAKQRVELKEAKKKQVGLPKTKKFYLPPFGRDYRKILGHDVLLCYAYIVMVKEMPDGGFSYTDEDIGEYFLFPAEKGDEILDAACKLSPSKHELWNPDLSEFYEEEFVFETYFLGGCERIMHISKELPDEVLDNLTLL